jgi:hypothetical protein
VPCILYTGYRIPETIDGYARAEWPTPGAIAIWSPPFAFFAEDAWVRD